MTIVENINQIILLLIFLILFRPFIKPFLKKLALKTKTELDEKIIDSIANPLWIFVAILVFDYIVSLFYHNIWVEQIFRTLEVIVGAWVLYRFIKPVIEFVESSPYAEEKMIRTVISVLENIIKILISFIVLLVVLSIWNIDVTPILASAGLIGITVGFALKDIIENILSGILIFLDPPFKVGDIVEVDGYLGEIREIGIRNTKIKTFDNRVVTIPNSSILKSDIVNYNLPDDIVRVSLKLGVSYDTDPSYVKKVILEEVISKINTILKYPEPQVLFLEFGDFALIFEIRFWVYLKDKLTTIDKVNTMIWKVFKEKGIDIPYPIRTIYLKQ